MRLCWKLQSVCGKPFHKDISGLFNVDTSLVPRPLSFVSMFHAENGISACNIEKKWPGTRPHVWILLTMSCMP